MSKSLVLGLLVLAGGVLAIGLAQGRDTVEMLVAERVVTPVASYTVVGAGYFPQGDIIGADHDPVGVAAPDLRRLLRAVVLCNDARLGASGRRW